MVVAPTADAAMREWMQTSACDAMPLDSGVSSSHSPLPPSANFATKSRPDSRRSALSPPSAYLPSLTNL